MEPDSELILQIKFYLERNRRTPRPRSEEYPAWFWKLYDVVNQGYNIADLEPSWLE